MDANDFCIVILLHRYTYCISEALAIVASLLSLPAPWVAVEMGWFVAEFGRQPWAIGEVLPTALAPLI